MDYYGTLIRNFCIQHVNRVNSRSGSATMTLTAL